MNDVLKLIIDDIQIDLKDDKLEQRDDATIIFLQKEKFPTILNLDKINLDLKPLISVLQSKDLPEDTEQLINKYGKRCIQLVEELINIDIPSCQLFANAYTLPHNSDHWSRDVLTS